MSTNNKSENGISEYTGAGLRYVYNPQHTRLYIHQLKTGDCLIDVAIELKPQQTADHYLKILDKTMQVQAAIASDYKTVDITDIFHAGRIRAYLLQAIEDAAMTLFLKQEHFNTFETYYCALYGFETMRISKADNWSQDRDFYKISLKTLKGNMIEHSAEGLPASLLQMSRHIVSDLIMRETKNNFEYTAHRLLAASTKLSILSLILNDSFDPKHRIVEKNKKMSKNMSEKTA